MVRSRGGDICAPFRASLCECHSCVGHAIILSVLCRMPSTSSQSRLASYLVLIYATTTIGSVGQILLAHTPAGTTTSPSSHLAKPSASGARGTSSMAHSGASTRRAPPLPRATLQMVATTPRPLQRQARLFTACREVCRRLNRTSSRLSLSIGVQHRTLLQRCPS